MGAGLIVAWSVWPRRYATNLVAGKGETIFGPYLKIAEDGRVIVAVPQVETGQGVFTVLALAVADELGADWRTVGVEPAPINPLYANRLFAEELAAGIAPRIAGLADGFATRTAMMVTAGSTSARMFERPMREAAALARAQLCMAAAKRWGVAWDACETDAGFVTHEGKTLRFAALAAEAAGLAAPDVAPLRLAQESRRPPVPRLDTPSKLDGSANFSADVRLPGMVFAAIRQGPIGAVRYLGCDRAAADRVPGAINIIETISWVAAVANSSWAAERAVQAIQPRFEVSTPLLDDAHIRSTLATALQDDSDRIVAVGDIDAALGDGAAVHAATYHVAPAAHASLEPVAATASWSDGVLQIWLPTLAPEAARRIAAHAVELPVAQVIVHPMLVGGGFGRGLQQRVAAQAAVLACRLKRPVQLLWSRSEDILRDRFRPPATARLVARIAGGKIDALRTNIATPSYGRAMTEAVMPEDRAARAFIDPGPDGFAVAGAETPYAIPNLAVEHHPVEPRVPIGYWRSAAHSYTCFFTESFVDEMARTASVEPFSFRMGMLGGNARLARCLSTAATLGGWQGGEAGSGQGLAIFAGYGSFIAVLAEAQVDGGRIRCSRLVAVADVGRTLHGDIVRQQIEGGMIFGLAAALGAAPGFAGGYTRAKRLADLNLPRLADCPDISVELLASTAEPGGASELAVPPIAPALANALFAASGQRCRTLPLVLGAAA